MSKAEDLAEKAYPYPAWSNETTRAIDDLRRNAFIEGYHQAEKDLKLGWEDIYEILYIERHVLRGPQYRDVSNEEFCTEVLKRFKSYGKKEI